MDNFPNEFAILLEIEQHKELVDRFPILNLVDFILLDRSISIECDQLFQVEEISAIASELLEASYYLTGRTRLYVYFEEQCILQGEFTLHSKPVVEEVSATMVATLEKKSAENAPAQVSLPIADVQVEPEQLYPVDTLISHVSARTGMDSSSIQQTIELLKFPKFKMGGQVLISARTIPTILNRWAEAVAGDVQATLYEEATRPAPLPKTVAKSPAKKVAAKKSTAKKPVAKSSSTEAIE
jgi:hypothetical protein